MLIQSGLSSIGLSFSDYFPKTIKFPGFFISHISVNTYFPPPCTYVLDRNGMLRGRSPQQDPLNFPRFQTKKIIDMHRVCVLGGSMKPIAILFFPVPLCPSLPLLLSLLPCACVGDFLNLNYPQRK